MFWVDLPDIDFTPGKATKKLTLTGGAIYMGNVAALFQPAEVFEFLAATVK